MSDSSKDASETSESLIVALAKLGDVAAFSTLVDRHQSRIRGLMRHLSADVTQADDFAQQTFLAAWRDIGQLRDPRAFGGWLKRIAVNLWLKHLRLNDPLRHSVDNTSFDPTIRETNDIAIDLQQALSKLTESMRACVVLSYVEGMSHGEISAAMDMPLGTVKSNIRRGTDKLRVLLSPYNPEPATI